MPGPSGRPSTVAPTAWAAGLSSGAVVAIGVLGALAMSGSPLPSGSDAAAGWRPEPVQVVVPGTEPTWDAGPSDPVRALSQLDRGSGSVRARSVVDTRRELVQRRALPTGVLSGSLDPTSVARAAPPVSAVAVPARPDARPGSAAPARPGPPPHAHTQGRPAHAGVPGRPAHAAAPAAPKAHTAKTAQPTKATKATKAAKAAKAAKPAKPATRATKAGKRATRAKPATSARPASSAKPSAKQSARPQAVRAGRPVAEGAAKRAAASAPVQKHSKQNGGKRSSGPDR